MRTILLAPFLVLLSLGLRANEPAALPFIFGQAFHILPQTHNNESGYFSLCEGLDGKLFVGTAKYGVNSYLVELDPGTGEQRVVIDTHKLCGYTGTGYAAQAKIHTRNFVAPSGTIYVASKQGYPEKDENLWSYPGGFLMSYDPRTDAAQSYGMVPYHGCGVIDVAADESRGLIYYVTCQDDDNRDHLWGVYDTRKKQHRLLGPHAILYGSTLLDEKGKAYIITSDYKLASYDPDADKLTVRDILLDGKPFDPAPGVIIHQRLTNWAMAPDGKSAYLLMLTNPTLYRINLAGGGKTTTAADLGKFLTTEKSTSAYSLVMHPDGNIYTLLVTPDPAGKAKGNLNVLARYEPATKTMRALGAAAIRNTDYFDFSPRPDGTPKPWSHGVETLADGTLVPAVVNQGLIAGRDGTLYALLLYPFAVLKIDDYRVPPATATPAKLWLDASLAVCDRAEKQLPEITRIAEEVAKRYEAGGRLDVILNTNNGWPGQGPQAELTGRSGGIIDLGARYVPDREKPGRTPDEAANDVIIIGWQRAPTPGDIERIKLYQGRGAKVLGFGPKGLPALAECEKLCDYWIDTGFGADDRALTLDGDLRAGRANTLANLVNGWTFTAEFVGALTRRGKMPPMWKAMLYQNDWEPWFKQYGGKARFHEDIYVPPLARCELGNRFLNQIRWHLRKFENTQLGEVQKAAGLIADEHAKGKKTVVTIAGHCMFDTVGKYEDAAWAQGISFHGWVPYETRNYLAQIPRDSLVLVLSYCGLSKGAWSAMMGAGQKRMLLVTSENDAKEYPEFDGPKDESLAIIDMGHAYGDACTRIDGYPLLVFPPSGIMQAVAYGAVDVEVQAKIAKEQPKEAK
ncbi:MAG: hypothetical protein ACYDCO_05965 [Armatimonadota bacterium]